MGKARWPHFSVPNFNVRVLVTRKGRAEYATVSHMTGRGGAEYATESHDRKGRC